MGDHEFVRGCLTGAWAVAGRRWYVAVQRRFVRGWPHRRVGLTPVVVAGLVGFVLWLGVADAGAASEVFFGLGWGGAASVCC